MKSAFLRQIFLLMAMAQRLWALEGPAQAKELAGGRPGEWLTAFSASARDAGLGHASTALTGSSAFYANPAGLANNRRSGEVNLMVAPLYSSSQFQAISLSYPTGQRDSFGAGILYLGSGKAEKTDSFGESIGSFEEKNTAFFFSVCRRFFEDRLDSGVSIKMVRQSLADYSSTSYGMDWGLQGRFFWDTLRIGLAVQNLIPPQHRLRNEKETFPTTVRSGASFTGKAFGQPVLMSADVPLTSPDRWALGTEISPLSVIDTPLFFRAGLNHREYTIGLGIGGDLFSIDYALSLHRLEILHRIGITMRFSGQKRLDEEWERLRRKETALKEMKYMIMEEKRIREKEETPTADAEAEKETHLAVSAPPQKNAPLSYESQLAKARAFYGAKRYQEAVAILESTAASFPDKSEPQILLSMARAHAAIEAEDYKGARGHLLRVVEMDPDHQEATLLYQRIKDIMEIESTGE